MGLRVNMLLIGKKYEKPFTELTIELGLGESEIIQYPPFEFFPSNRYHPEICMGHYGNTTIITYSRFIGFFEEQPTPLELQLCRVFYDTQMLLLSYRENEGDQGFLLFSNGERIRAKFIEEFEGTILDIGPKLEEEKEHKFSGAWPILSKRIIGKAVNFWDIDLKEDEIDLDKIDMYMLKIKPL